MGDSGLNGEIEIHIPGVTPEIVDSSRYAAMIEQFLDELDLDEDEIEIDPYAHLVKLSQLAEVYKFMGQIASGFAGAQHDSDGRFTRLEDRVRTLSRNILADIDQLEARHELEVKDRRLDSERMRDQISQQAAKLEGANRDRFIEMIRVSEEFDHLIKRHDVDHNHSERRIDQVVNILRILTALNTKRRTEIADLGDEVLRGQNERDDLRSDIDANLGNLEELLRRVGNIEDTEVELMSEIWNATFARDRMDERTDRISGSVDEIMLTVSNERGERLANTGMLSDVLDRVGRLEGEFAGMTSVVSLDRDYESADGVDVAAPLSFDPDDDEESVSLDTDEHVANLPLPASASRRQGRTALAAGMLMGIAIVISLLFTVQITNPFASAYESDDDYAELEDNLTNQTFERATQRVSEAATVVREDPEPTSDQILPPQEPTPEPAPVTCQSFGNWELRSGVFWLPMFDCSDGINRLCPKAEVDARTFQCDFYQPSE